MDVNDLDNEAPLGAPNLPPYAWLTELPEALLADQQAGDITVIMSGPETGRAFGIYYDHDVCYLNDPGECWLPPASPSANEAFVVGTMPYSQFDDELNDVLVGTIPITGGHTPDDLGFEEAVQYRNDLPERQRLVGTLWDIMLPRDIEDESAGERQVGIFIGAATPEMTVGEALMVNRSGLSGEWWPRENFVAMDGTTVDVALDALGPVLVTKAAIPTNRGGEANASIEIGYSRAASGVVHGPKLIQLQESNMGTKADKLRVDAVTACQTCRVKKAATADTGACCDECAAAEEAKHADVETKTAEETTDTMGEETSDNGDLAERVSSLEAVVASHESAIAELLASGVDSDAEETAARQQASRAPLGRLAALPAGMSYGNARQALDAAVQALVPSGPGGDVWVWVMDFDETHVFYEWEAQGELGTYRQMYSFEGSDAVLTGEPEEVVKQYAPASEPAADTTAETTETVDEPAAV